MREIKFKEAFSRRCEEGSASTRTNRFRRTQRNRRKILFIRFFKIISTRYIKQEISMRTSLPTIPTRASKKEHSTAMFRFPIEIHSELQNRIGRIQNEYLRNTRIFKQCNHPGFLQYVKSTESEAIYLPG